jgi:predicted nucleic acid-binding protein
MATELEPPEVILCDTSFVGRQEAALARPETVAHWPPDVVARLERALLAISVITLAEIRAGRIYARWGQRRADAQEARLAAFLLVPLDEDVLAEYAVLHAWSLAGNPQKHNDLWIAATAIARGIPLVSCDRHFEQIAQDQPLDHIYLAPAP